MGADGVAGGGRGMQGGRLISASCGVRKRAVSLAVSRSNTEGCWLCTVEMASRGVPMSRCRYAVSFRFVSSFIFWAGSWNEWHITLPGNVRTGPVAY